MEFYVWNDYRCAYDSVPGKSAESPALLLIHPIGVGLSRHFWQPFIHQWQKTGSGQAIYNPDLLGCGESDMPQRAYQPSDWAEQLACFIETIVQGPVVLVVQGALLPVAVRLMELSVSDRIAGLVLSGPPAWPLMSTERDKWKTKLAWQLFASPLGNGFYRYARRESFLRSFSERQLFEQATDVSDDWLSMLHKGSRDMNSRWAVYSFLAGYWRQDYTQAIARIQQPVLVAMGEEASTIDRAVAKQLDEQPDTTEKKRLQDYIDRFPRAVGVSVPGRNVLPYESTHEFVQVVSSFLEEIS